MSYLIRLPCARHWGCYVAHEGCGVFHKSLRHVSQGLRCVSQEFAVCLTTAAVCFTRVCGMSHEGCGVFRKSLRHVSQGLPCFSQGLPCVSRNSYPACLTMLAVCQAITVVVSFTLLPFRPKCCRVSLDGCRTNLSDCFSVLVLGQRE